MRWPLIVFLCALLPACDRIEARSLVKQGNTLYREGRLEQALTSFRAAAALDPKFPLVYLHLGYTSMALAAGGGKGSAAQARQAAEAFSRYVALAPLDPRGPKFYLQVLLDAGRLDEALRFLEREHQRKPKDLATIASLGMVASKAGRFAEALRWYEARARLAPRDAQAHYLIGTLCWNHLHRQPGVVGTERARIADRGIAALERANTLQPDYVEALTYINLLYRERATAHHEPSDRARDLATAERYRERAKALLGKRAAK